MKKRTHMKRGRWHRFLEMKPDEYDEYHIWGEKIGSHVGIWTDKNEWVCFPHDPFDVNLVTHFFHFPLPPRPPRR